MLSKIAQSLSPSPTLSLDAKVKSMQASGIPVINLCLGEPDFHTPKHIQKAATQAMREGFTHYTATAGVLSLRKVIADKFARENNLHYDPSQIIVGMGSKQLLYLAFQVICEKDDEVLIPTPTWSTFVEQVKFVGAKPVLVPLEQPFQLTAEDIEKYITKRTKVLLLNSPANPTGAMIKQTEMKKIAQLVLAHNIFVIADEIYEKVTYEKHSISFASLEKSLMNQTITINGFSKAYAMTGWRIGYAGGPREIIDAMTAIQSQTTSNASSISQIAGMAALTGEQEPLEKMVKEFSKRREFVIAALSQMPNISFTSPEGAFYVFVSLKELLDSTYPTSAVWCEGLLVKKRVAVVPGEAFLAPGYFRLSFATSLQELQKALERIAEFVSK